MLEPQHDHDCDECVFLGRVGSQDVWQHDDEDLILRFGSDPQDYSSMLVPVAREYRRGELSWDMALQLFDAYMLGKSYRRLARD